MKTTKKERKRGTSSLLTLSMDACIVESHVQSLDHILGLIKVRERHWPVSSHEGMQHQSFCAQNQNSLRHPYHCALHEGGSNIHNLAVHQSQFSQQSLQGMATITGNHVLFIQTETKHLNPLSKTPVVCLTVDHEFLVNKECPMEFF